MRLRLSGLVLNSTGRDVSLFERFAIYHEGADRLAVAGVLYPCYEI